MFASALLLTAERALAENNCIQNVWAAHGNSQSLTCTANDVTLSSASNICVSDGQGGCKPQNACDASGSVTFTADFTMPLTAQTRYDIGLYLAADGGGSDGALTGACNDLVATAQNAAIPGRFINLDRAPDVCGDIDAAHNPQVIRATITAACQGVNGQVAIPFCTSWRQPGSNEVCDSTTFSTSATWDSFPGSPSKCNCGTLLVDIFIETASINVTKTALTPTVAETGGSVMYQVDVQNLASEASVTADTLIDNLYGDVTTTGHDGITDTTCDELPPIPPGETRSCTFTVSMPASNSGNTVTDIVTVCGTDSFGHTNLCDSDDAVVTYTDVSTNPSLSKSATSTSAVRIDVNYTVVVTNNSTLDTLTVGSLNDDKFGDITTKHAAGNGFEEVVDTLCASGATLQPGAIYQCSFVGRITQAGLHKNTVTGTATDDDGVQYGASELTDDASVNISITFP